MMQRRNPAVLAGLLGASTLLVPQAAGALTLVEAIDGAFPSPTAAFAAGAAGGAALVGALAATVALARQRRSRTEQPPELDGRPGPEPGYRPRHLREDAPAPEGEDAPAAHAARHAASHAAHGYEEIAENYVRRATFRERMALRAEGVASALRDRLGSNMMEGIPVIERADGSVGDVGTAWWNSAVGEGSISSGAGFAEAASSLSIPSDFSRSDASLLEDAARRSEGIARRVAPIDEGVYPEHRTAKDLDETDEWLAALRSLDEQIAAEAPQRDEIGFVDAVGGDDSLDEPDNLEPATSFIPFKTPAGHPEVVDTDSYVDYLIQDEFSKNSSTAARRSSRRFLRLLEGGTQATASRHLAAPAPGRRAHAAKHFATSVAAEA